MASSSSMPLPLVVKDEEPGNWSELPPELMSSIMGRLGAVEILENVQLVCRPWRRVSKDPLLWRKIDMGSLSYRAVDRISFDRCYTDDCDYFANMCRNAVDRSEGGLVEISIGTLFCTDSIITYIADRSSNLRRLGLYCSMTTDNGLENAVAKLPLLEELEVSHTWSRLDLKAIGHSCPKLKTLKLNYSIIYGSSQYKCDDDDDALAIAETMPQLHHLQLIANRLTDIGLNAILDNCTQLEHLDLRCCLKINLSGYLENRCLERVKEFRRPTDSTADSPHYAKFYDTDDELDYLYGPCDVDFFSGGDYDWY